eukprot:scaffold195333_cov66-Cyclotella_meneghiniana.AAC.2
MSVGPSLPNPTRKSDPYQVTVVEDVLPGYQSTSRLGQTLQMDVDDCVDSLVWTPAIPIIAQIYGVVFMALMQGVAMDLVLFIMYYFFVPAEPTFWTWMGRCFLFFSPWPMGIPYALLMVLYKWTFIGRFQAGTISSPSLDIRRWLLRCMCQSRLQTSFEVAGASSEILNTWYRLMGMKVGWNVQLMPLNLVEYDLFSVGDNVAFGGQVFVCCRTADGLQENCSIGSYSAITNSAGMLAGSSIGDNCLVGNLTLLPPGFSVPNDSKCVGTKYLYGSLLDPVTFANVKEESQTTKLQSNVIGALHMLGSLFIDAVYLPEFVLVSEVFTAVQEVNHGKINQTHLVHNPLKVYGGYLLIWGTVIAATVVTNLTICLVKRLTPKFLGTHKRDSFLFVLFIWLTKHQMNMEQWSFIFNGTPVQSFFYRLLGARVSLSSRLFMRFFADLDGLVIGEKAILSYDCYLEQHKKTSCSLEFGPITILKNTIIGQRSIALKDSTLGYGSQVYPLSAVPPKEMLNASEVRGGILADTYFLRSNEDAISDSAHNIKRLSSAGSSVRKFRRLSSAGSTSSMQDVPHEVDMVVVGAGISGLVAAYEFQQKNVTFQILEKTSNIMGCWARFANNTSHVAVTEATYRLSSTKEDEYECDYPSREQVLEKGADFFQKRSLNNHTEFGAEVINIEDFGSSSKKGSKLKHGHCIVTYKKSGIIIKVRCKGVFIATGAQALRNEIKFKGEEDFSGRVLYGSNDLGDVNQTFEGKTVCIVGGGAFAMENMKTALVHGATRVILVHRSDFQVWPRCAHYLLSSEKDRKFSDYNELYQGLAQWAGLSVGTGPSHDVSPFMHPDTKAQPTANDSFFAFYKLGLIELICGNVCQVSANAVTIQRSDSGVTQRIPCDVLLKCVGWRDPGSIVRDIYPSFRTRNFVFLNESPRIVFICDPRYRHDHQVGQGSYEDVLDTVPIGGTYSVPILARIAATLQLYCLGNPLVVFDSVLESIPPSDMPLCSWTEAKFQYPKAKEISEIIRQVIDQSKSLVTAKHAKLEDFLAMNMDLLGQDLMKRIKNCKDPGNVGYDHEAIEGLVKGFQQIACEKFEINMEERETEKESVGKLQKGICMVSLRNLFDIKK